VDAREKCREWDQTNVSARQNAEESIIVTRKPQSDRGFIPSRQPIRVLVTAFGAFPGAPSNPTENVVKRLRLFYRRRFARLHIELVTAVMPVRFDGVAARITTLLDAHRPDIVIHLGLAARRKTLSVETRALNRLTSIHTDATGGMSSANMVLRGGEPVRRARWAAAPLAIGMSRRGALSRTSIDAGDYLCNQTLYLTLGLFDGPAGFIHMPSLRRRMKSRMASSHRLLKPSLQEATEAIAAAIERTAVDFRHGRSAAAIRRLDPVASLP
jgi:pyroglutamyl-peptidase